MKEYIFNVSDREGVRVDSYLGSLLPDLSRSYLQKLIKDGLVFKGEKLLKSNYKVKEGDEIRLLLPENTIPDIEPEDILLDILFEDDDVIVVNKPKNMVVHPAAGHYSGTLVNALLFHCRDNLSGINGVLRPGIVHRIDMNTTGALIACKNDASHREIANQLREHSIKRRYHALVCGVIREDSGTVDAPLGRDPKDRKKMAIVPGGKGAVTHYRVLERFEKYTYIECSLETGRTHQIRVHMASIHHPLLGDFMYNPHKSPYRLKGQTLHAKMIGFVHPKTGEYLEIEAPMPDYFSELLSMLPK